MKSFLLFIFFLLTGYINAQSTVIDSILSGGIYRNYRLYVPAVYNGSTARPLIINMHGYTSNANAQQLYSNFMPIADTANFLMVYPNGTVFNGQPFWNAGISSTLVNDVAFISNLIDSLKAIYNIDLESLYACGMSNGGFMSQSLACQLSNKISAIASVTGSMFTTQLGAYCQPSRPVPVMQISGTNDATVPYNGNTTSLPIDSVVKYWVQKNGCNPVPSFSNVPNTNIADGCTAEHYIYSGGLSNSSVELYKIINGGHTWPGFLFGGVGTNLDINASKEIWRFFRKYKLSLLTSNQELNANPISFNVFPNPVNDYVQVEFNLHTNKPTYIAIYNSIGELVLQQQLISSQMLDVNVLKPGIYFLSILVNETTIGTNKIIKF